MNVSFNQVSNAIVSAIQSGFLNFETLTNGIRVALTTNANWTFGVTGYVSGTSLNLGIDSSQFSQAFGVGLAPGDTVILVDGATNSIVNRTSVVTSATSVIFTNMQVGLPIRWWGFSSNGAFTIAVPQSHTSNTVSRGIEQPFSNTWIMVEAIRFSSGWTNFDSEAQGYTLSPGSNVTFTTNDITQDISVSAAASAGFASLETLTNGVRVALSTNQNWVSYVTGMVSGTTAILGVDALAISNSILGANAFRTNQFTTNIAGTPVRGSLAWEGTVGDDITNGARRAFEWIPTRSSFRGGQLGTTASVSNYWDSTNIGPVSFAYGSNVLAIGPFSTVHGMMNLIRTNSHASSILGGSNNIIGTNVFSALIVGGYGNSIGDNHDGGTIGGGGGNIIDGSGPGSISGGTISGGFQNRVYLQYGFIGGGSGNDARTVGSTIVGGINNDTISGQYQFVGGGEGNRAEGDWSVVGGGHGNVVEAVSTGDDGLASGIGGGEYNTIGSVGGNTGALYSWIAGGRSNFIPDLSAYGFIGGGSFNQVGGGGNAVNGSSIVGGFNNITDDQIDFAFIGGGVKNKVGGDFGAIVGGVSNSTTAAYAYAFGNWMTNTTTKSVEIGVTNANKMRVETFLTRMIGMGHLYQSNSFALPSAATIGVGGYWVGNSNGVLVSLKSLDGTTTVMKILDQ